MLGDDDDTQFSEQNISFMKSENFLILTILQIGKKAEMSSTCEYELVV